MHTRAIIMSLFPVMKWREPDPQRAKKIKEDLEAIGIVCDLKDDGTMFVSLPASIGDDYFINYENLEAC